MLPFDLINILLIIINFFVIFLFALLVYLIYRYNIVALRSSESIVKSNTYKHAQYLLFEAQKRSQEIIKAAAASASSVLKSASSFSTKTETDFLNQLNTLAKAHLDEFDAIFAQLFADSSNLIKDKVSHYSNVLENVSQSIQEEAKKDIKNLSIDAHTHLKEFELSLDKEYSARLAIMHEDLRVFQEKEEARIKQECSDLVFSFYKDFLKQSLSEEECSQIVNKVFERIHHL